MQLGLVENTDAKQRVIHNVARVIYEQTGASSLRAAEAMASMISNAANVRGVDVSDVVNDADMFGIPRYQINNTDYTSRAFQMCVRVARRMMCGALGDVCCGATRFHHSDVMPQWAMCRGYIADIDGMLFYL